MKYRGLHDDLSRGPVPTLAFQKHLIQVLAAYKVNLYSPYFENNQFYTSNPLAAPPGGSISPAEARELTAFAAQYHIAIAPEQEAFGHLRHTSSGSSTNPWPKPRTAPSSRPGSPGPLP